MPVDKFELMGDENAVTTITTIQPLRSFAINLDDLENVRGFNNPGSKDKIYGFQLTDQQVYERAEISTAALDHGGIEDKPLSFVYDSKEKKLIPLPIKYNWDIDIKLKNNKFFTDGISQVIHKIVNSGYIIGGFVPVLPHGNVLLGQPILSRETDRRYSIKSRENKEAQFEFTAKDKEDKKLIANPPVGTTIIIDGQAIKESIEFKEIIPGLQIKSLKETASHYPFDFRIVLFKGDDGFKLRQFTPGVEPFQIEKKPIALTPLKIHDFYSVNRFRVTALPVNDYEIKYL